MVLISEEDLAEVGITVIFFEHLFGGRRSGKRSSGQGQSFSQKGEDMNASITIPLEDAYQGSTRRISFQSPSVDPSGNIQYRPMTLNVKIPKGIQNGKKIRLAGKGGPGINGGNPGDLYITVEYEPNHDYHVEGSDVYINLPVAPWEVALGDYVIIPTPAGNVKLKIHREQLMVKNSG